MKQQVPIDPTGYLCATSSDKYSDKVVTCQYIGISVRPVFAAHPLDFSVVAESWANLEKSMRRIALPNILERSSWVVRCRSFTFLPDPKAAAAHYGARLPKRRLPPAGRGPPDDGHAQRFRPPQAG